MQYYDISAKSNYQYDKPFLWLLKQLFGDNTLGYTKAPITRPAEIQMDPNYIKQIQQDRIQADKLANTQLPDEDDDF